MLYVLLCKLYFTLMFYRYLNTTHIVAGYEQNDWNFTRGHQRTDPLPVDTTTSAVNFLIPSCMSHTGMHVNLLFVYTFL